MVDVILAIVFRHVVPVSLLSAAQEPSCKALELRDCVSWLFGPIDEIKVHVKMSPFRIGITKSVAIIEQFEGFLVGFATGGYFK